jgi:hypothetical protein
MKKHIAIVAALGAALLAGSLLHTDRAAHATGVGIGYLVGHVSLSPGVNATSCQVSFLAGTPGSATCDAQGNFAMNNVVAGSLPLLVTVPVNPYGVPARTIYVAIPDNYQTGSAGDIVLGKPGAIAGRIRLPATDNTALYDQVYVGIPALGVYAPIGLDGQYLLTGVGPGTYTVEVSHPAALQFTINPNVANVVVSSGRLTTVVDLLSQPSVPYTHAP